MSDIVDTSPLGIERTERIAGDEALNSRLDTVTTELQSTQESVTTEVLHRSEGDLVIQRILEGYIQDLLEGKAEDFERYIEFQNSQNLNYADVRNFVSSIRTSLADDIRNLSTSLMNNLQANDARYNKLVSDVDRYLEILSDITLDSNQITLDNGELRAGAWTILSQARAWDLETINRLNGLSESVGDSLKDAVEEIQNQLPSTEETITKAIEELSNSPLIKNLSDQLNQSIENDIAYELALVEQARQHANAMAQLAEDMRAEALAKAQAMEDYMAGEVTARITEVNKEVAARKEAIDLLTEDMLTRVDQDKADFQADMLAVTNRIKSAEDGLTSEIQQRKDGDSSTLNALNTYKVSNDSAITGLSTSLSNNVTKTNANTTLITGLTSRLDTAEDGIESATTAAADAMSKATTAVSANSALATRVDALAASITESEGTVVDVNAFNALKAEVNTVKGVVTGLVEDVTALESSYTTVNNKVTSQGTAISTLNTKMTAAENSVSQSANDITLLKTDISSINSSLLTKVDSQAFSQLSSDVSELDGKYTTQAGLVTDLRGSLDTTNVNVGNAASAAQNALNTAGSKGKVIFGTTAPAVADRLSQNLWIDTTGNANTPKRWNGSAWVVVTDKVATDALAAANAATNLANTKADTSAFNSLDQKVTVMDGKVSTNTNSITSLNGKIAIVEGGLATKLDSSAIVNYYTKQQADDKALSTAAGEISKYDASLVIGGVNLIPNSFDVPQSANNNNLWTIDSIVVDGVRRIRRIGTTEPTVLSNYTGVFVDLPVGTEYTISVKVKPIGSDYSLGFYGVGASTKVCKADQWTTLQATIKAATQPDRIRALTSYAAQVGIWIEVKEWQAEIGNKATAWSPSPDDFKDAIDANATAIQNTNTEVGRVDGKTTVNANSITGLSSRMGIVEGQVSTKAEASALQNYYTKTEAAENATTVAAGEVSKYDASLVIGGTNLFSLKGLLSYSGGNLGSDIAYITITGTTLAMLNQGVGSRVPGNLIPVDYTKDIIVSWYPVGNYSNHQIYYATQNASGAVVVGQRSKSSGQGTDGRVVITIPKSELSSTVTHLRLGLGSSSNTTYSIRDVQVEQGNKVTAWSPSPRDTQAALDANASAIQVTNSEVSRIDGVVTSQASSISNLQSGLSTTDAKANTAINNAATAQQAANTAVTANQVNASKLTKLESTFESSRDSDSLVADYLMKDPNQWQSHYGTDLSSYFTTVTDGKISNTVFRKPSTVDACWNYSRSPVSNTRKYKLSMWVRCDAASLGGCHFTAMWANAANPVFYPSRYSYIEAGTVPKTNTWTKLEKVWDLTASGFTQLRFGFAIGHSSAGGLWEMQGFKVEAVIADADIDSTIATSSALEALDTKVTNVDGRVTTEANRITTLTGRVSTVENGLALKANVSALNNIYTKSETDAKATSLAAGEIAKYDSSLNVGGENLWSLDSAYLVREQGNASIEYIDRNKEYYKTTVTAFSASNVNITRHDSMLLSRSLDDVDKNSQYTLSFEIRAIKAGNLTVYGYFNGANTVTGISVSTEWKRFEFTPSAKPAGTYATGTAQLLAFAAYSSEWGINDWYEVRHIQMQKGTKATAFNKASLAVQNGLNANATALGTLDTKVIAIDGKVTTQASQLVVLTSDNNANKNALSVQGKVIDGVKANYMVKMETNGVIGGFGIIQEATGAMGTVTTTFGVNANAFFIGAPASKKQPFIVTTTNQDVNGVKYPAGTYIDVALIANATIGTAKIADLAVTGAKIANATIGNAKISDLDASKINAGFISAARIQAGTLSADKLSSAAIETISLSARNGTFTAADGSKQVISGGSTEYFYPSGRRAIYIGV